MIPLYAFVRGDVLGLVVVAEERHTIAEVAALAQEAACMRVAPRPAVVVIAHGRRLEPFLPLAEAGLQALDRIDVVDASDDAAIDALVVVPERGARNDNEDGPS